MVETTLVGLKRLKDFTLFENRIGTVIPSYVDEPPAGCLYLGNNNTQVSKTEWSELYEAIGGADGSTSGTFVLPYKPDEGDIKYYIVGKVLISDVTTSGNISIATFTNADLDVNGRYTFLHGIGHTHPILQLIDNNGREVVIAETTNSVGQSVFKVTGDYLPSITGTWEVRAIG